MKKRTFFTTFILFLLFLNGGIFLISLITLKDSINGVKERSLNEHYFIVSSLTKDFLSLENREMNIDEVLQELMQSYLFLSEDKKVHLTLYKENQPIFSNTDLNLLIKFNIRSLTEENRMVSMKKSKEKVYLVVSGKLPVPYDFYALNYWYDFTEHLISWNHMKNMLYIIGVIFSSLLAFCLLLLLGRIFRPLGQISEASQSIASGNYENRISISGHDELANMGKSFNHMADEIQEQIAKLAAVAEQKQQFIDNFAHELRTPLTAIYGYAEYIQKAVITEDDKLSATSYIMSECSRLQAIAYQLLELATLRGNEIERKMIDVSVLFHGAKQTLLNKVMEKQIQIKFICKTDFLYGDKGLLESLLVNLVDNAVKACEYDGKISVGAYEENNKKILFVQDNGNGMTKEQLTHVTEAFYRGDTSRGRKEGGAGLGLSICEQIAAAHNAALDFISEPGKGTRVELIFTIL